MLVIPSVARDPGSSLHHQYRRLGQTPRSLAALGMTLCGGRHFVVGATLWWAPLCSGRQFVAGPSLWWAPLCSGLRQPEEILTFLSSLSYTRPLRFLERVSKTHSEGQRPDPLR